MSWTDERIDVLRRLWADGLSASQIANSLGGVSRNAVIGKIHRLGLSGRVKAPQARSGRQRVAATLSGRTVSVAAPAMGMTMAAAPRARAAGALAVKVVEREAIVPIVLPAEVVPLSAGVTLFELTAVHCRWPLGDAAAEDLRFCGTRVASGDVYCRCHAELAFPARRRKAN